MFSYRKIRKESITLGAVAVLVLALAACGDPGRDGSGHDHGAGHDHGNGHEHEPGHDHGHEEEAHGDHHDPGHEAVTVIPSAEAEAAGVRVEPAGPATLVETVDVLGKVDFAPDALAAPRARYPGKVVEIFKTVGDVVTAGEVLARVESNESLQTYAIIAPIGGVILERSAGKGDVTGEAPLFRIGDPERLHVDFHVFSSDLPLVRMRQKVLVQSTDNRIQTETVIAAFLPTREAATQTVIARAPLPNPDTLWVPGTTVRGAITVAETPVPLAVRTQALQRFRGGVVVFVRSGERYEARTLKPGRRTPEWTEVLEGIEAGELYVTENSFLIKADIEKSGATHQH